MTAQTPYEPEDMNAFIDRYRENSTQEPLTTGEEFTAQLLNMADNLYPETDFAVIDHPKTVKQLKQHFSLRHYVARVAAVAGIIVFASLLSVLIFPDVRAFAQDILESLFGRSESARMTFEPVDYKPDDIVRYNTIEALENAAGFTVHVPSSIPDGYVLVGSMFVGPRNTTILTYMQENDYGHFSIQQQPLEDMKTKGILWYDADQDMIGPRTKIELIPIDDISAEFVQGTWTTGQPNSTDAVYEWDNRFPVYTMRWTDELMLYEIRMVTNFEDFDMETFTAIATSMMQ